jgi:N-acetylglucosaminyl-diphospho-decaprenol L-rhamnosyltransferase
MDLTISIISTNERDYLDMLLPQIYKVSQGLIKEIIIVDNCSDDNTSELGRSFPDVRVIRNDRKRYFSYNHNKVIESARGRYVLLLNPDIMFNEDEPCITRMVQFMDENPGCGISGCRVYNYDRLFAFPARRFPSLATILSRRLPFVYYSKSQVARHLYKENDMNSTFDADWLSGCFLMIRKTALDQAGLLDERFLKYFEDVDICRRLQAWGWQVLYYGGTYYFHLEKRSSKKLFSRDAKLHLKSWFRWISRQNYYNNLGKENLMNFDKP